MRLSLVILILLPMAVLVYGQNAPITRAAEVNNPTPGSNIIVPITVTGFQYVGAISLTLDYDYSVMTFAQGIQNASIPGMFIITDSDLGNGFHRLLMGWYGFGLSLPDNSSIMDIEFNYISGSTELKWIDDGPSCEYADGDYVVMNDLPSDDFYINGYICGPLLPLGPISGDDQLCQQTYSIAYSIDTISNATAYTWTVPSGASIIYGQSTNSILVDYSDTAQSGNISVFASNPCASGNPVQLMVNVNELPVANAGNDTTIPHGTTAILHAASGGMGDYSYSWTPADLLEDPEVQNPQTLIMNSSNLFTVTVTNDSSLCEQSDNVLLSISGGPLNVNPLAFPDEICNSDSAQLFANSGGGSGEYTYSWTSAPPGSPPWSSNLENPMVSPDSNRTYLLEVFDGFTTTSGQLELQVNELPTAHISGGGTLCGDSSSILLPVNLTGIPPWSFTYSFGTATVHVSGVEESPYFIHASDSGTYILYEVNDANCTGTTSGFASLEKQAVPSTPSISFVDNKLISSMANGNQWYRDGVAIEGASESIYTPIFDGTFFDIVTLDACSSNPSNSIDVVITNVEEFQTNTFRISPNPAKDQIYLSSEERIPGKVSIKFFTVSGNIAIEIDLRMNDGNFGKFIDIKHLPQGLYFVSVSSNNFYDVQKIIVK